MAKDPAFLFYPGDWMGGTQWMTHEQKGCYMDLLILQYNTYHFTESQAKQVLSICFDLAWATIKDKFKQEGDYYYNERLRIEVDKRRKFTESRRINASKKEIPVEEQQQEKAQAEHMPKHMENENKDIYIYNEFYDKELSDNTEKIEFNSYKGCVAFLFGDNDLKTKLDCWLKIDKQLTYEQYEKIVKKSREKKCKISEMLLSGYNTPKYTKGIKSIYATLNNWINRK